MTKMNEYLKITRKRIPKLPTVNTQDSQIAKTTRSESVKPLRVNLPTLP